MLDESLWTRIVVVSPHLDDAVLGTAHLLGSHPGSVVVTALAGRPPRYPAQPTPWDAACGFVAGEDVVAVRRREDGDALATLGAEAVWLDFVDWQYRGEDAVDPTPAQLASSLSGAIGSLGATAVFLPFGLLHPYHVLTHRAALLVRDGRRERARPGEDTDVGPAWFCYEEHGYKHLPGLLAQRIAELLSAGVWATPAMVPVVVDEGRKRAAVGCYRSQLAPLRAEQGLTERLEANVPEQYWRLTLASRRGTAPGEPRC